MPLSITDGALAWQRLAVKHAHPRDARISFEEETHTYTIDGSREGWTSCTGFIHTYFAPFEPDVVIEKMMKSLKWKPGGESYEKYNGMSAEEIKKKWNDDGGESSSLGTRMHLDIEHYNNAEPVGNLAGDSYDPNLGTEWNYFLAYERKHRLKHGFEPFRTEWLVFKEDIKLAGSIDMVYKKPDGTLAIYDWKRAKDIKFDNQYQKGLTPLEHLPDTNYWHYSLQLNIYRRILEELYDVKVSELALVVLHPNNPSYRVIKLNRMDDEVTAMFEDRARRLADGTWPAKKH
jgi:PD-(D/E)XK nuclease superfamily